MVTFNNGGILSINADTKSLIYLTLFIDLRGLSSLIVRMTPTFVPDVRVQIPVKTT